ncbi:MAG: hypothetical protein HYZ49_07730 [Chloroflexi bacterium]|nr:hypothetical protein [Chloroflexota bacterium]
MTLRLLSFLLLLLALTLTACTTSVPEVAPPLVVTVVVTANGGAGAPSNAATPVAATAVAVPTSSYPTPNQIGFTAAYQPFERGFMIYVPDRKAVWVFVQPDAATPRAFSAGLWLAYSDTFKEGEPETDPALTAPEGLIQPKRGFGKVWRENGPVEAALGWATEIELPYPATITDYALGRFDGAGVFVAQSFVHTLTDFDGKLIHIDEATRTWSKP